MDARSKEESEISQKRRNKTPPELDEIINDLHETHLYAFVCADFASLNSFFTFEFLHIFSASSGT